MPSRIAEADRAIRTANSRAKQRLGLLCGLEASRLAPALWNFISGDPLGIEVAQVPTRVGISRLPQA
jgi:hypothetical protein